MHLPNTRFSRRRALSALGAAGLSSLALAQSTGPVRVAVAANLRYAMEDLAQQFEKETSVSVVLSIGASGSLLQQIRHGAPFALYMSADEEFVLELARLGLGANGPSDLGVIHSLGSLALCWNKKLLGPAAGTAWKDYLLATPRLAIANPEHAPFGRAAIQWLERVQLAAPLKSRLVLGDSAAQALQFVSTGAAPVGLLPFSLAVAAAAQPLVSYTRLSDLPGNPWSPVLRQKMLLLRGADANAKKFYLWLQQSTARAGFQRHGFELP